jgi:hypothetical protein
VTSTLGKPCWKPDRVASVITSIAKMDASRVDDFLATHSPVSHITDEVRGLELTEETLHSSLWDRTRGHVLAVVFGDPGTGKSHLIHWLKLRCDQASESGELKKIRAVLVQRRTGSLRDALTQLVEQLPSQYARFLQPVQQAIGNISQATAREMLAQKLALELGTLWKERDRPPLPHLLKDLSELCSSTGTRDWLCRPGGVIDRNIRRLTELSTTEDRGALPDFTGAEFNISQPRFLKENTPSVRFLIDEIEDDPRLGTKAADAFNLVLRDALNEMSGLGGARLRDIFDQIRAELNKDGQTLALFVEDVSVMSSLDKELFHALEPQSRTDLCPLVAVLGMTLSGRKHLAENELQRVTHRINVGTSSLGWDSDSGSLDRFAARYLNAVRLPLAETHRIARDRRSGDIALSACTECEIAEKCHGVFGKVDFEGVSVGLFPLTPSTATRLLRSLDVQRDGVRRNPRGFLEYILRPLLNEREFENTHFPRASLFPVRADSPHDWSAFEALYCSGYAPEQRMQLQFLAQAWVDAGTLDELARGLAPLAQALGLPPLPVRRSGKAPPAKQPTVAQVTAAELPRAQPQVVRRPPTVEEPKAFKSLQADLQEWVSSASAPLRSDGPARDLLLKFLKGSLPWDVHRGLPRAEFDRLLEDKKSILIEGQQASPAVGHGFAVRFARSAETFDLIGALARFDHLGNGTWVFPNGEHHKRVVGRWLRRNGQSVLESLQPEGLDTSAALRTAIQCLCLFSVIRRHAKLPDDLVELVQGVLASPEFPPTVLSTSGSWKRLVDTLATDFSRIRDLVLSELNVPQGPTGGVKLINPVLIIETAREWSRTLKVAPLDDRFLERHWKARYAVLEIASHCSRLEEAIEPERVAIKDALKKARDILADAELPTKDLGESVTSYCAQLTQIVDATNKHRMPVPDPEFDRKDYLNSDAWARALNSGSALAEQEGTAPWVMFDATALKRASEGLERARKHLAKVERELSQIEAPLIEKGDPDQLWMSLLAHLDAVGALGEADKGEQE